MYVKFASSLIMQLFLLPGICLAGQSVDRHDQGIVDDYMSSAMKAPRPRSVSLTIQEILSENNPDDIESLNLSGNTIGDEGAEKLSSALLPQLKNLKVLNISYNVIREEGLEKFIPHLCSPNLQFFDIFGNDGTDLSLMKKFFRELKTYITSTHNLDGLRVFNAISEKVIFVDAGGILSRRVQETISQDLVSQELLSPNWLEAHKRYYKLFPQD